MFSRTLIAAGFFAVTFVSASLAMAQSVEIEATTPEVRPKFEILRPEAPGSEVTRPNDANIYRGDPVVNYDPAFIEPFSTETSTGRMGLAGWTSPVGGDNDHPQGVRQPGWLSFGFAITWGGPTPAERRATAKPTSSPAPR
ncbi:MAG: hypothetical protein DMD77_14360 [Candidatus Rokuibacteriota bacterium]|nr:MAG: hypothetical protein DME16_21900 [Candidatus Rokubacteria bacterium]PYM56820.1 MAG: hypothetical protein DMD77_14360 [Candidatus Rokubacteria bacterium]